MQNYSQGWYAFFLRLPSNVRLICDVIIFTYVRRIGTRTGCEHRSHGRQHYRAPEHKRLLCNGKVKLPLKKRVECFCTTGIERGERNRVGRRLFFTKLPVFPGRALVIWEGTVDPVYHDIRESLQSCIFFANNRYTSVIRLSCIHLSRVLLFGSVAFQLDSRWSQIWPFLNFIFLRRDYRWNCYVRTYFEGCYIFMNFSNFPNFVKVAVSIKIRYFWNIFAFQVQGFISYLNSIDRDDLRGC